MLSFKTLKKNKREKKGSVLQIYPRSREIYMWQVSVIRQEQQLSHHHHRLLYRDMEGGIMFTHKTLDKHTKNERVPAEQFSNKPSKPERKKKEFSIHPKSCDPFRIFIFKIKEKRWLTQINHIGAMRELYQGILIII